MEKIYVTYICNSEYHLQVIDKLAKDKTIKSKEKQSIVLSIVGNIAFLVPYCFMGPIPGVTTKSTPALIGVSRVHYEKIYSSRYNNWET